jgi:hypothetical protein
MPGHLLKHILCVAATLITWAIFPGSSMDRILFSFTAGTFAEPPFFITGDGSREQPHTLRTLKRQGKASSNPLPDIAITDDPERVFQSSPPSPVDFAIILKNLQRLGRESVAIGMPLAWPEPDVISLTALDQQLDSLTTAVTCAPLSRSPVPSPLPPAFRRASLPGSKIDGNIHNLPLVNRISLPDVILGNTTSLAGFTVLESEPDGGFPHLLARWDDRIVLAFPLLVAIADHKADPSEIEIRLGQYISLGNEGPYIPIDGFGRLTFKPFSSDSEDSISAETLIDASEDLLAADRRRPILIRNTMSAADEATLRFSGSLVSTASILTDPSGTSIPKPFPRIPWLTELLLIASLISLIHGLSYHPKTAGRRTLAILAAFLIILHFVLIPITGSWLPTIPALVGVMAAIPLTPRRINFSIDSEQARTEPITTNQREFQLEIETPSTRIKTAKPTKKAAKRIANKITKKIAQKAAKTAPAKKSPRKRKGS